MGSSIRGQLWTIRKIAKVTQTEMAAELGVTQSSICRIEKGLTPPTLEQVTQWAEICGMKFTWKFEQTDRSPSAEEVELFATRELVKAGQKRLRELKKKLG